MEVFDNSIKKTLKNQDFTQQVMISFYFLVELYRALASSLLIIFVPQDCGGNTCTFNDNLYTNDTIIITGTAINGVTFLALFLLYIFELNRELKMVKYLDVNPSLSLTNEDVGQTLTALDNKKINKIYFIDGIYEKLGIVCVILFICNTVLSGYIINGRQLNDQTYSTFVTNISFMLNKIYNIYVISTTEKNIFYSAYLTKRVQFNDVDPDYKYNNVL